jgi:hypothetical protein
MRPFRFCRARLAGDEAVIGNTSIIKSQAIKNRP